MKCQRQPAFLSDKPTPITDVWEVGLSPRLWNRLASLARMRSCTYSTITRFCAFLLAEPEQLRDFDLFRQVSAEIRQDRETAEELHRHMLCLYGEDVKLLRLAAMRLNLTVSAFIRLALWLYLPRLAAEKHGARFVSQEKLFLLGTKRWILIPYAALNLERSPTLRRFAFASFPPWCWW